MKTLLKYESKIQQILVLLSLVTFISALYLEDNYFSSGLFIIEFFLLAFVQYTFNIIKFFNKIYLRTDSRNFYMCASTFVVVSFLLYLLSDLINAKALVNILEIVGVSWVILSPILIIQSLYISWFDLKNKIEKQDLIDGNSQK